MRGVLTADAGVAFAAPDHLLFIRQGALRAQKFDTRTLRTVGEAVPIAEHVQMSSSLNFANISASTNGLITYVVGGSATIAALKGGPGLDRPPGGSSTDARIPLVRLHF